MGSAGPLVGPRGRLSSPTGRRIVKRKLLDESAKEPNKSSRYTTRTTTKGTTIEIDCATELNNGNDNNSHERTAMLQKALELLGEFRAEFQGLKETLKEQNKIICDQQG